MDSSANELIDEAYLGEIRRDMTRFARLQLGDEAQAEDAVQDTLLAALGKQAGFSGRSSLKTWVFAILKNKIIDLLRQQSKCPNISSLAPEEESLDQAFEALFQSNAHWLPGCQPKTWGDPEAALNQQRFWAVFDACLAHLPANTARVFMMREFLELETTEICQTLSLTTTYCNVILHRARNGLRRCLEKNWFVTGAQPC
ncbi:MAG: sigma-70 family RNA polymerase sigma factor [Pseudomonadota bacterium]